MNFFKSISDHRLVAFISGTLLLQACLLSLTSYYRSSHINHAVAPITIKESRRDGLRQAPLKIEKPVAIEKDSDEEQSSVEEKSFAANLIERSTVDNNPVEKNETVVAPKSEASKITLYKIVAGDTLTKIWIKNGASVTGSLKAAEAFKKAGVALNTLKLNDELKLTLSKDHDITRLEKKLPHGKTLILTGNAKSGYESKIDAENITERERTVSYPIYGSFAASAHEVSVPSEIIDDLVDLFSGRLDFRRDLQPGDSFSVIYTERLGEDGGLLEAGPIKAISIKTGGKLLAAIRYVGKDGKELFFDENGQQIGDYFLRYPLKFTRISSIFTEARFHPILGINRPHNGVDFAAPIGTPVRSIGEGTVEVAHYGADSGNMISIRHNEKYTTNYLHLSKFAPGIKPGVHISRGEVIGAVGMTGLATGPHLHFALFDNGKFVNPLTANLPAILSGNDTIPKVYLASTMKLLTEQHDLVRLASLIGFTKNSKV